MDRKKFLVAPSILSADFGRLAEEIKSIEECGADWVHIDVMDGVFVPNITIGPVVVKSIRKVTDLFFDVHLMIENPEKYVDQFSKAGSDIITFHVEACDSPEQTIGRIRSNGKKAGVSVKPGTDISAVKDLLPLVDMVLIMTVEPGFGGQSFMGDMVDKITELRSCFDGLIQVDGGIDPETSRIVRKAGVDVVVAGSAIFGKEDYAKEIEAIRGE